MVSCTIVIPTHNRDDLLVRAVRSAIAACPNDGEVIVVDDKSNIPAEVALATVRDARLKIVLNEGPGGAAAARNFGVAEARGKVVFFLDDDDEFLPGYCARVLDRGCRSAEWGYCSSIQRHAAVGDVLRQRKRLGLGLVQSGVRPQDAVAAMSDGFWIKRRCFESVGGLDADQIIDEDTDLCLRLWAKNLSPWYEVEAGVVVYRAYVPANIAGAQLTLTTSVQRGLECYRRSHDKNVINFGRYSSFRWFLATRYLRRAIKAGEIRLAYQFTVEQKPVLVSLALKAFVLFKRLRHA